MIKSPKFSARTVILYGPPIDGTIVHAWGGGIGGYVRNMETYLTTLKLPGITMHPVFHTVRGQMTGVRGTLPIRMAIDGYRIIAALWRERVDAVHLLGSTRTALPRAALLAFLCKFMHIPLVYDIKAGTFITNYETSGWLYRALVGFIVREARVVLVEGEVYRLFLKERFNVDSHFFPNFVDEAVVPTHVPQRLVGDELSVLFVGYCYEGKGVIDLVEGCVGAVRSGMNITLTLVGEEQADFGAYLDGLNVPNGLRVRRLGRRNYADVRHAMLTHDVFCFPSRHIGEGHSNAINEAMMSGMVIVCTRHGFLESVVSEAGGYLMDKGTKEEIEGILKEIAADRPTARARAKLARMRLLQEYTSTIALRRFGDAYRHVFDSSDTGSRP